MYRGCGVIKSTNEMDISEKEIEMSLAGMILFLIWVSLCVVIVGGWAFKTLDDDVIPNWDDEIDEFDDVDFPTENENEQGNLL